MNIKSVLCKLVIMQNVVQEKLWEGLNKHIESKTLEAMVFTLTTTRGMIEDMCDGKLTVQGYFQDGQHNINGEVLMDGLECDMWKLGDKLESMGLAITKLGSEMKKPHHERMYRSDEIMKNMTDLKDLVF